MTTDDFDGYPNRATQHFAMILFNDHRRIQLLTRDYKQGWTNIHRIKRIALEMHHKECLDYANVRDIDYRFILCDVLNYFYERNDYPYQLQMIDTRNKSVNQEQTKMANPKLKNSHVHSRMYWGEVCLNEESTDAIFEHIKMIKKAIDGLATVAEDSKAAANQIAGFKKDIRDLANYVDKREKAK